MAPPARQIRRAARLAAALSFCGSPAAAGDGVRAVALTGDPYPGAGAGVTISRFDPNTLPGFSGWNYRVFISDAGEVAMAALMDPPPGVLSDQRGILIESGGVLSPRALPGDPAPRVGDGLTYESALPVWIDGDGLLWWEGRLAGPGVSSTEDVVGQVSNESAVWMERAGQDPWVVREGDGAPGRPVNFRIQDPELEAVSGRAILRSFAGDPQDPEFLEDQRDDQAWTFSRVQPQALGPFIIVGDGVPDTPSEDITDGFLFLSAVDAEDAVYVNALGRPPLRFALFQSGLPAVPEQGVSYEGLAPGGVFVQGGGVLLDDAGVVALSAAAEFEDGMTERGCWLRNALGDFDLIAREGDTPPEIGGEQTIDFISPAALAPDGLLVLAVRLLPGNDDALWTWHPDEGLREVFRAGGSYPWLPEGADSILRVRDAEFGASGDVLFTADLEGPGIAGVDRGFKAMIDRFGNVHPLAHAGGAFEVGEGDVRTVFRPGFGFPIAERVNARGRAAFWMRFEDGSEGVFVADARELGRCAAADLSEPLGELDFLDVLAYVQEFAAGGRRADLGEPLGVLDFTDVFEFLGAFAACD